MPRQQKVASIPDRIRGGICFVLTIATLSAGANATDKQWQLTFVVSGILYMMTTLAMVFKDVDTIDS